MQTHETRLGKSSRGRLYKRAPRERDVLHKKIHEYPHTEPRDFYNRALNDENLRDDFFSGGRIGRENRGRREKEARVLATR